MVKDKIPKGFPLGIKVNVTDLINGLTLDKIIELTKVYHDNCYVVGYDTLYCEQPHYHIHFASAKETSEGAMKTFRSNVIKKQFPHISKSFRFYTGQDLPSADISNWYAYALKETAHLISNIKIDDNLLIEAKAHLEVKKLKKLHSEKKSNDIKEKKEFKEKMFEYVKTHIPNYDDISDEYYGDEQKCFEIACIEFLIEHEKYGSMKKIFLTQYYLEWKVKHSSNKWTGEHIYKYLHQI